MKRLEEDLGTQLFERSGKSVQVSQQGKALLADAEHIVNLYQAMKGATRQTAQAALTLGVISTAQLGVLPGALRRFRTAYPAAHINVLPGMSVQLLAQVDADELDLAVLIKPNLNLPRHLKWFPLMQERYVGIAPHTAQGDWGEVLRTQPFIRYNRRSYGGHPVDQFLKHHASGVNEFMELDEPAVILQMVREGLGCAIIPGALVDNRRSSDVRMLELPGPPFFREIGIVVQQSALKNPVLAELISNLSTQAEQITRKEKPAK